jgi:hypothetical protein
MPSLKARALKCTIVLDPTEVDAIDPNIAPRVLLHIDVAGYTTVTADIAAKALRKVQTIIGEHGSDGVACVLQGKLIGNNTIGEAGLVAQIKQPKSAPAASSS